MTVIDWHEEVKEYKKQYDEAWADSGNDGISEYIESMLPVYYGEIYTTYHEAIGTPFNIEVEPHHVGLTIDKILLQNLFDEYYDQFTMALHVYEEEE